MPRKYHYTKKTGRPTKYRTKFIKAVDKYINLVIQENKTAETPYDRKLITKEEFAMSIGVDDETLDNWAEKYPKFFGAMAKIMNMQKLQLLNDGTYGGKEVNSTIVKLILQNNHGMKEKTDMTTDGKALPTPIYNGLSTDRE